MNFVKIKKRQLDCLKNLPNNLNDTLSNQNISGLLILDKLGQFKQIILDFQITSMEEFYIDTDKNKNRIKLFKHIKNENPRLFRAITFEVINKLNNNANDYGVHLDSNNIPTIDQWIKCTIHSVFRKIYNHIVITSSDNIYAISIKKTFYYEIYHKKLENKWKIREILHYLIKFYTEIYHSHKGSKFEIPSKFSEYFHIVKCKNNDLLFTYRSFNETLAIVNN
jgi:hypothetical protein